MHQNLFGGDQCHGSHVFARSANIPYEIFNEIYGEVKTQHGLHLLTMLLHLTNTGSIKLKSTNPFQYPAIEPNYLSDKQDIDIFIEGIRPDK